MSNSSELVFKPSNELENTGGSFIKMFPVHRWGETIAKFHTIGIENGKDIFDIGDNKLSFELDGTYKGQVFTLYDWKNDFQVHMGGNHNLLDVDGLIDALNNLLKITKPTEFKSETNYGPFIPYSFVDT